MVTASSKAKMPKRQLSNDFVDDTDDTAAEEELAEPAPVKQKRSPVKKSKKQEDLDAMDQVDDNEKPDDVHPMLTTPEGEPYFEIGTKKRVTVRKFKGNTLVDIREFYTDKDDNGKPGKKGISLTLDQYNSLQELMLEGHLQDAIKQVQDAK